MSGRLVAVAIAAGIVAILVAGIVLAGGDDSAAPTLAASDAFTIAEAGPPAPAGGE